MLNADIFKESFTHTFTYFYFQKNWKDNTATVSISNSFVRDSSWAGELHVWNNTDSLS